MFYTFLFCASVFLLSINGPQVKGETTASRSFKYLGSRTKIQNDGATVRSDYYVGDIVETWGEAYSDCFRNGHGELVSIEDEIEDQYIMNLLIGSGLASAWTSGMPLDELDGWMWASTGGRISYVNWKPGQPTNTEGPYRILVGGVHSNYGWYSSLSALAYPYICEKITLVQ